MPCAGCKGLAGCSDRFTPSRVYHRKELVGAAGPCVAGQTTTRVDAAWVVLSAQCFHVLDHLDAQAVLLQSLTSHRHMPWALH